MEEERKYILLIEDDHDDAEMTLYTLGKLNLPCIRHIDDGVDALSFLFSDDITLPAVIILDLKMPKVDGIEILTRLKQDPLRKNIPVLALISSSQGQRFLESHAVKADGYLLKPVQCAQFVSLLSEVGLGELKPRKPVH